MAGEPKGLAPHVEGQLIVKIEARGLRASGVRRLIQNALGKSLGVRAIEPFQTDASLQKVTLSKSKSLMTAMARLNHADGVVYAEPNFIYSLTSFDRGFGLPNDARASELWGMKNTGQADKAGQAGTANADINVVPLWDMGIRGDKKVVVAVIDTGIDWTHPDLLENLYTNKAEIAGNGIDDDHNGFIDDIHGWNFEAKSNNSSDDHDHGSHCAGTIGGVGDNGQGVVGVNWNVTLMPLKFLSASGSGTLDAAVEAINYGVLMHVNVMSNSWGGGGMSLTLRDSIVKAKDAGILFVAAAGNAASNNDSTPSYPASYDIENVLSVAASDNRDMLASFSCYGKRTVHVAAPGNWILSTVKDGKYDVFRGTSMATPHVAGVAALLLSVHPEWTFSELKDRLNRSSDKVASLKRKVQAAGRVNAYSALMGIYPPSNEPDETAWRDVSVSIQSEHPYKENSDLTIPVQVPGAKFIRIVFDRVDLEQGYDRLWLEDSKTGERITEVSGRADNLVSDYVEGDTARLRFTSDFSVNTWGFEITRVQAIY